MELEIWLAIIAGVVSVASAAFAFLGNARKGTYEAQEERIDGLEAVIDNLKESVERRDRLVATQAEQIKSLTRQLHELEEELEEEREARRALAVTLEAVRAEKDELRQRVAQLEEENRKLRAQMDTGPLGQKEK